MTWDTVLTAERVARLEEDNTRLRDHIARLQESVQKAAAKPDRESPKTSDWSPRKVLPAHWKLVMVVGDGAKYQSHRGLTAIVSVSTELDGKAWLHLSVSRRKREPSWADLVEARNILLGDVMTYQVIPPSSEHVNIHSHVLHLWHCLEGDVLPDFTRGSGSL